MEQAVELARRQRPPRVAAREQPALLRRHLRVVAAWPHLPPLPQKCQHLRRQHDIAILASFGLDDADDALGTVDIAHPEANDLAGAQAAAVPQSKDNANLEAPRHRQQAPGLVRAHDDRDLLRLLDVIYPDSARIRRPPLPNGAIRILPNG